MLHGLLVAFEKGAEPVARDYLHRFANEKKETIMALIEVWAREMGDDPDARKARALLFGLENETG